jgi:DegV family protein with EDD domain
MTIAIVTDSTADIPEDIASSYGIQVVPAVLIIEDKSYIDGKGYTREEFYQNLPGMKTPPTTATPSTGTFEETYSQLVDQGASQIISIHAPARLSGIFNSAAVAAQKFEDRVTVIDSGLLSLGIGFQVISAAEAARYKDSVSEIISVIDDVRRRIHLIAMLDSLEYIRRSGRVSWTRASLGALLQIKPFVTVQNGEVLRMGEARTRRKGIEHLYDRLKKLGSLEKLAILHTNAEADAYQMLNEFASRVKSQPLIVNVTTIIGTHVGPNGLGFVAVVQ